MGTNKKYCPLIKNNCLKEKCMWNVIGLNNCSINIIAQSIDSVDNHLEDLSNDD